MAVQKLVDIFKSVGQPTVTYVNRNSGELENTLISSLDQSGQLCLVTGPSKTGKTTLYREVLVRRNQVPLIVRCDASKTCKSIWTSALEAVNFEQIISTSGSKKLSAGGEAESSGKIGWSWLAEATARFKGTLSREVTEAEARQRILSDPGPDLLIPLLKGTNYVLVVEDFHYLPDEEKVLLFQQWKRFVDNEVTVLVLGTTHRAIDIANSNPDLVGRTAQIDVGRWNDSDLKLIARQGFDDLDVKVNNTILELLATEAVGLPIIVQQTCLDLFVSRGISVRAEIPRTFRITQANVENSLHRVATLNYSQFGSYYSTIVSGARERSRIYTTYELVLACFTLDPISFSLRRSEIDERLSRLAIDPAKKPPAASLNSTLGALNDVQRRRNFRLLEWIPSENKLYIIEPAFLFYVRWRQKKDTNPAQLDFFEDLLRNYIFRAHESGPIVLPIRGDGVDE